MIDPYTIHDPFASLKIDALTDQVKKLAKTQAATYIAVRDELVALREQNIQLLQLIIELQAKVGLDDSGS